MWTQIRRIQQLPFTLTVSYLFMSQKAEITSEQSNATCFLKGGLKSLTLYGTWGGGVKNLTAAPHTHLASGEVRPPGLGRRALWWRVCRTHLYWWRSASWSFPLPAEWKERHRVRTRLRLFTTVKRTVESQTHRHTTHTSFLLNVVQHLSWLFS